MEKIYRPTDENLLKICKNGCFDADEAWNLIRDGRDVSSLIVVQGKNEKYLSTYLFEAVRENNFEAVDFLLCFGAKVDVEGGPNPMAELLKGPKNPKDNAAKLKIAKLLLDNGADVNTVVNGKTLFEAAEHKLYRETYNPENCYMTDLLVILLAYGAGKTDKEQIYPIIRKPLELYPQGMYKTVLSPNCSGKGYSGSLETLDGELVADL